MIKCSKCGEIVEDGKNFCPNCENSLIQQGKKTRFPFIGGILLIITSSFSLVSCIILMFIVTTDFRFVFLIFGIWGFAIGLTGGIYSIKRKRFFITIVGCSFVLVYTYLIISFAFGKVLFIVGILSTIFILIAEKEFRK
jgi:hypothetical protein